MKFNVIRKVQKGNYLALDNKKYIPLNKNNKRFILPEHSQINIFYSPIDKYHVYQNGVKLYLKDLNETEFNQVNARIIIKRKRNNLRRGNKNLIIIKWIKKLKNLSIKKNIDIKNNRQFGKRIIKIKT